MNYMDTQAHGDGYWLHDSPESLVSFTLDEFANDCIRSRMRLTLKDRRLARFYMTYKNIDYRAVSKDYFREAYEAMMHYVNDTVKKCNASDEPDIDRHYPHAFLGGSKTAWLNYDDEKLVSMYARSRAAEIGTVLHSFAEKCLHHVWHLVNYDKRICEWWIRHHGLNEIHYKPVVERVFPVLQNYVNEILSLDVGMTPELELFCNKYCYGTSDAIGFDGDKLLICDLKTGEDKPTFKQLQIYAAMYCLINNVDPSAIRIEARLYWRETLYAEFNSDDIVAVMETIQHASEVLATAYGD